MTRGHAYSGKRIVKVMRISYEGRSMPFSAEEQSFYLYVARHFFLGRILHVVVSNHSPTEPLKFRQAFQFQPIHLPAFSSSLPLRKDLLIHSHPVIRLFRVVNQPHLLS